MATATVTSKGQITIPVEIRKQFKLKAGDRVDFVVQENAVRLYPRNGSIENLKGILGRFNRTVTIEEMNEAIAERGSRLR